MLKRVSRWLFGCQRAASPRRPGDLLPPRALRGRAHERAMHCENHRWLAENAEDFRRRQVDALRVRERKRAIDDLWRAHTSDLPLPPPAAGLTRMNSDANQLVTDLRRYANLI